MSISSLSFYKAKVLFGFSFFKFHNWLYNPNAIFILFSNTLLLVIVVFVLLISFTVFCFSGPNKSMLGHFSKLFLRCEGKELSGCGISLIPYTLRESESFRIIMSNYNANINLCQIPTGKDPTTLGFALGSFGVKCFSLNF